MKQRLMSKEPDVDSARGSRGCRVENWDEKHYHKAATEVSKQRGEV